MESWFTPYMPSCLPDAKSVLVLSPHPDDEIFGCAGALLVYKSRGVPIHIQILTDGAGYSHKKNRGEISAIRYEETCAALSLLGLSVSGFSGFKDRHLMGDKRLHDHIHSLLIKYRPDLIISPAPSELHPDHRAVTWSLQAILKSANNLDVSGNTVVPCVLLYEVSALQQPNLLLDITNIWELKLKAMQCFKSQLANRDYIYHIEALNRYRTYTLGPEVRYAEAYSFLTADYNSKLGAILPDYESFHSWVQKIITHAEFQAETQKAHFESQLDQLSALHEELTMLRSSFSAFKHDLKQFQGETDSLIQSNKALLASNSWRLTAPLRWIARKIRHIF